MKQGEAMEMLGLVGTALAELTDPQIRLAFANAVKLHHPDTAPDKDAPARIVWTVDALKAARDVLLNRRNVAEFACKTCKGKGTVRYRMGTKRCEACRGTGETRGS